MPTHETSTIKPSGGDYTTLSAWEAAKQGDLVTADQIQQAECYNMSDTTAVVVDGWTTDATRNIKIYGAASDKTAANTGKWSTERYRLSVTNNSGIVISEGNVRIYDLQIYHTVNSTHSNILINANEVLDIQISNSILTSNNTNWANRSGGIGDFGGASQT